MKFNGTLHRIARCGNRPNLWRWSVVKDWKPREVVGQIEINRNEKSWKPGDARPSAWWSCLMKMHPGLWMPHYEVSLGLSAGSSRLRSRSSPHIAMRDFVPGNNLFWISVTYDQVCRESLKFIETPGNFLWSSASLCNPQKLTGTLWSPLESSRTLWNLLQSPIGFNLKFTKERWSFCCSLARNGPGG